MAAKKKPRKFDTTSQFESIEIKLDEQSKQLESILSTLKQHDAHFEALNQKITQVEARLIIKIDRTQANIEDKLDTIWNAVKDLSTSNKQTNKRLDDIEHQLPPPTQ